jgi:hypothetical protein
MDQVPQRAFIKAEAVSCIEASGAGAAEGASAFQIERKSILERSLALGAEKFGRKGAGSAQTRGTNRNARIAMQRGITEAAFVGKKDRKKSVRNLP